MTDPIDIAEGYSAEPYGDGYIICHSGGGRAVAQLDMAAAVREITRLRAALAAQVPQWSPTDAELDALRQSNGGALTFVTLREFRAVARAVLAAAPGASPQPPQQGREGRG